MCWKPHPWIVFRNIIYSYSLYLHIFIASTKSQIYTSFSWAYFIKVWNNSRSDNMQQRPRISSTSNTFYTLDLVVSFSTWSLHIFVISVLYLVTTCLCGNNMEIQQVLMLWNILLPLMSKKAANFYNSSILLGLWVKGWKHTKAPQKL
jgi:hypothetical protein